MFNNFINNKIHTYLREGGPSGPPPNPSEGEMVSGESFTVSEGSSHEDEREDNNSEGPPPIPEDAKKDSDSNDAPNSSEGPPPAPGSQARAESDEYQDLNQPNSSEDDKDYHKEGSAEDEDLPYEKFPDPESVDMGVVNYLISATSEADQRIAREIRGTEEVENEEEQGLIRSLSDWTSNKLSSIAGNISDKFSEAYNAARSKGEQFAAAGLMALGITGSVAGMSNIEGYSPNKEEAEKVASEQPDEEAEKDAKTEDGEQSGQGKKRGGSVNTKTVQSGSEQGSAFDEVEQKINSLVEAAAKSVDDGVDYFEEKLNEMGAEEVETMVRKLNQETEDDIDFSFLKDVKDMTENDQDDYEYAIKEAQRRLAKSGAQLASIKSFDSGSLKKENPFKTKVDVGNEEDSEKDDTVSDEEFKKSIDDLEKRAGDRGEDIDEEMESTEATKSDENGGKLKTSVQKREEGNGKHLDLAHKINMDQRFANLRKAYDATDFEKENWGDSDEEVEERLKFLDNVIEEMDQEKSKVSTSGIDTTEDWDKTRTTLQEGVKLDKGIVDEVERGIKTSEDIDMPKIFAQNVDIGNTEPEDVAQVLDDMAQSKNEASLKGEVSSLKEIMESFDDPEKPNMDFEKQRVLDAIDDMSKPDKINSEDWFRLKKRVKKHIEKGSSSGSWDEASKKIVYSINGNEDVDPNEWMNELSEGLIKELSNQE